GHHFVGAGYDRRDRAAAGAGLRDRLDQRRMVAAEIREDVGHAGLCQGFEQGHAAGVHRRYPNSSAILRSNASSDALRLPTMASSWRSWARACASRILRAASPARVSVRVTLRRSTADGRRWMKPRRWNSWTSGVIVDLSREMARPSATCVIP